MVRLIRLGNVDPNDRVLGQLTYILHPFQQVYSYLRVFVSSVHMTVQILATSQSPESVWTFQLRILLICRLQMKLLCACDGSML